jgi:hypothetical protein
MLLFDIEAIRVRQILKSLRCRNVLNGHNGSSLYLVPFQRGKNPNQASTQERPFRGRAFVAYLVNTTPAQPGRFRNLPIGHTLTNKVLDNAAAQPPQLGYVPLSCREAFGSPAEQEDWVFYRCNPLNLVRHSHLPGLPCPQVTSQY